MIDLIVFAFLVPGDFTFIGPVDTDTPEGVNFAVSLFWGKKNSLGVVHK
jgi:hypothetical protein